MFEFHVSLLGSNNTVNISTYIYIYTYIFGAVTYKPYISTPFITFPGSTCICAANIPMEGWPSGDSACSATAQRRLGKWPWPPWNRGTAKAGQRSPQNHGKNDENTQVVVGFVLVLLHMSWNSHHRVKYMLSNGCFRKWLKSSKSSSSSINNDQYVGCHVLISF